MFMISDVWTSMCFLYIINHHPNPFLKLYSTSCKKKSNSTKHKIIFWKIIPEFVLTYHRNFLNDHKTHIFILHQQTHSPTPSKKKKLK